MLNSIKIYLILIKFTLQNISVIFDFKDYVDAKSYGVKKKENYNILYLIIIHLLSHSYDKKENTT
jgi:hypothetical protein